jgi:hypothetical protein
LKTIGVPPQPGRRSPLAADLRIEKRRTAL